MLDSHRTTVDTASVIAARQLAEDAHRRRVPTTPKRRRRRPVTVPPLPAAREASTRE